MIGKKYSAVSGHIDGNIFTYCNIEIYNVEKMNFGCERSFDIIVTPIAQNKPIVNGIFVISSTSVAEGMLGIDYSAVRIGRKRFLMMTEFDPQSRSLFGKAKDRISQG